MLDLINDKNEVIGSDDRENIHVYGLLHREINVWLFNSNNELFLQKRSATKDTCPNLLDASAGGHVESGYDYEHTAIKELEEETGIKISSKDLIFLDEIKTNQRDVLTGMINNIIKYVYAYQYNGSKDDLTIEEGDVAGFEVWSIEKMLNLSDEEKKKFVPSIVGDYYKHIFEKLKSINQGNI